MAEKKEEVGEKKGERRVCRLIQITLPREKEGKKKKGGSTIETSLGQGGGERGWSLRKGSEGKKRKKKEEELVPFIPKRGSKGEDKFYFCTGRNQGDFIKKEKKKGNLLPYSFFFKPEKREEGGKQFSLIQKRKKKKKRIGGGT